MKTQKYNILFTIPNFKTAGSQYVLLSILKGLEASQYHVFVAVENNEDHIPEAIGMDARVLLNYSGKTIKDALYLSTELKKRHIHILHSWDYKSTAREALACRLSGTKYIYTKKNNSWSKKWLLKSLLAHHIAYDNPSMKQRFFNNWLLKSKISFIPHGVDLNRFKPRAPKDKTTFNLCCIGNIVKNKNQAQIIEALSHLPERIHLHLYGREDKGYRHHLDTLIHTYQLNQRIHFHGYIENTAIPGVLSNQDIFILASQQEGLPVSILEALACGIPVMSSDSGGGARYILHGENGGFIFDSTNDLVEKIKAMYRDKALYSHLSKAAIKNVTSRFSLEKEINAYKQLYLKLI